MIDKMSHKDKHIKGKVMLCDIAARNIKKTIMKDIKEAGTDIASACSRFHKKHEQKTGKPIITISEFESVTRDFSKLSRSEIDKLIKESKEENKLIKESKEEKKRDILKAIRKSIPR